MKTTWRRWVGPYGIGPSVTLVGVVVLLMAGVCVFCLFTAARFRHFARDPALLYEYPPIAGLLSHAGVALWGVAATVCLFSAWLMRRLDTPAPVHRCFFWVGLLNVLLMADDLLMFHEEIFPVMLGIPESMVLATYVLLAGLWLVTYRQVLLGRAWGLLAAALGCFVLSVGLDLFWPLHTLEYLLEDGAKLLGLSLWASYFIATTGERLLGTSPAPAEEATAPSPAAAPAPLLSSPRAPSAQTHL